MSSKQKVVLNAVLKHTLKPLISYYSKKYLKTHDPRIIHRLRRMINYLPLFIPSKTFIHHSTLNKVPITEVSVTRSNPNTILYLPGGGYIIEAQKFYVALAYRLAKVCSAKVILVHYRLAPENTFPAALNDVLAAYSSLLSTTPHSSLFIAGDSAGGGLALSTLVALRDKKLPLPTAAICLSPWTDLALTGDSLQFHQSKDAILSMPLCQLYASGSDVYHPLASPLYADLCGLPPLLIQVSNSEILFDDARRFALKAIEQGVKVDFEIWENLPHVWQIFGSLLPESRQAIDKINEFIKKYAVD